MRKHLSQNEIATFLQQLALLLTSGIPLIDSLSLLENMQQQTSMRIKIYSIKQDLVSGKRIAESFNQHIVFDAVICQLFATGELTGNVDAMLTEAAHYLKNKIATQVKLKQILFYPSFILGFCLFITLGLFIFVVPRFALLFADQNSLPWITQFIFYTSFTLIHYSHIILFTLLSVMMSCYYLYRKQKIFLLDYLSRLHLPYWHKFMLMLTCRNLALMLQAGVPLHSAIIVIANSLPKILLRQQLYRVQAYLEAGLTLHDALQQTGSFPSYLLQFIKLGEQSGTLVTMLNNIATLLDEHLTRMVQLLMRYLEPLIMIILGVLIGGVVIALYLPIFKLGNTI